MQRGNGSTSRRYVRLWRNAVLGGGALVVGLWFVPGVTASASAAPPSRAPYDVNGDGVSDLCEIWGLNGDVTNSGVVELHCASGAAGYSTTIVARATMFGYVSTHTTVPLMADVNGDGVADLCMVTGVNGGTTTSGRLQMQCADGAHNYGTALFSDVTKFTYINTTTSLPMLADVNNDGLADLCMLRGVNGGHTFSGQVELHCANAASSYAASALDAVTMYGYFNTSASGSASAPLLGDISGDGRADLCLVDGLGGGIESTIRCADAATGYTTSLTDTELSSQPYMIDPRFANYMLADFDGDGRADFCVVEGENGFTTGHMELDCYNATTGFTDSAPTTMTTEYTSLRTDHRKVLRNVVEQPAGPVPRAGPDQHIATDTDFTLSGSNSYDPNDGAPLQYLWEQLSGTSAVIDDDESETTNVHGVSQNADLTFRLSVTNAAGTTETDSVTVTVRAPK